MFKNALVSCSDKSGLIEFLKPLVHKGLRVVSTGGTSKYLKENGIPVFEVSEQTGFPEVMGGRVRTLHPRIHMALLARSFDSGDMNLLKKEGLEPFDLVIGNLYPFERAVLDAQAHQKGADIVSRDLIEEIDIGGPALLRASAKSYERITVICDPSDYQKILKSGPPDLNERRKLAAKVFSYISIYDSVIAEVLKNFDDNTEWSETMSFGGKLKGILRYGENPHQRAAWYAQPTQSGIHEAQILQGKELSYNNLLDIEAAVRTCRAFQAPCAVAVKHNNPCGVAIHKKPLEALQLSLQADPVSVFGGIVAFNRGLDGPMAELLSQMFLECIVAPEIEKDAQTVFAKKKNLRILQWDFTRTKAHPYEIRPIAGGFLVQSRDTADEWSGDWKILGSRPPTSVQSDLVFGWNVCQNLKSNAIAVVGGGQTLGLGMGQVNRVDSVRHAIERYQQNHKSIRDDLVLASDAFFPFPDSIELAANAGIKWIIQPGGSIKDEEVFKRARESNITMVITGRRHFKH